MFKNDRTFQEKCDGVANKLIQQMEVWKTNATCGSGQKCLYTVIPICQNYNGFEFLNDNWTYFQTVWLHRWKHFKRDAYNTQSRLY